MYKCKHFKLYELVPPEIIESLGDQAWMLLDERILMMIDLLQEKHKTCYINDWYWGGKFKWSGLRTPDCQEGSEFSQHKFGRGMDLKFKYTPSEIVREDITANPEKYKYITSMELETPHVHIDCRNWNKTEHGILTFKP